ncbi:MAG: hypothetical protein ACLFWG_00075 [Longimicrobiales bacterium]
MATTLKVTPTVVDLELVLAADYKLTAVFKDENGNTIDISNDDIVLRVGEDRGTETLVEVTVASGSHSDPTNGETEIPIERTDTDGLDAGYYFYQIWRKYNNPVDWTPYFEGDMLLKTGQDAKP